MGVDKLIYIGPYLEVSGRIEIDKIKIKRICPNHPEKESKDKFCSKCGEEIKNVEYSEIRKVDPVQFMYQSFQNGSIKEDDLWSPEYFNSQILPNKYIPNKIKIDDNGGFADISNSLDKMNDQIQWFKENFRKEILIFENAFGKDNVKILWGIASYWG
jgi:hypothetical protein